MHIAKVGTKPSAVIAQCDGKKYPGAVTDDTEKADCELCLWSAVRIVRVTEASLLARLYAMGLDRDARKELAGEGG